MNARSLLFGLLALLLPACTTPPHGAGNPHDGGHPDIEPRTLVVRNAEGELTTWDEMLSAGLAADAVFIGELHADPVAHLVEAALVADLMDADPQTAVSMEMLERPEQWAVDDYLDGIIDLAQFKRLVGAAGWNAGGGWDFAYQPIIDAARDRDGKVVAANAPRHYASLARTEGYERLDALPPPRRDLFDLPAEDADQTAYRERFFEAMKGAGDDPTHGGMDDETLETWFRAQLVWDATMAGSMNAALDDGATRVVHVCGRFHCSGFGGTVEELRQLRPDVRIVVVVVDPVDTWNAEEDAGRADFYIYGE
jgi:uncharacterized iron-regulated protein